MHTICRRIEWDAAHRVLGHENKCRHLHGHRYVAELTVAEPQNQLDGLARVVDFSVLKSVVGAWVDENWDHNVLLHHDDPLLKVRETFEDGKSAYVFGVNPTAESIAYVLFNVSRMLLAPHGIVPVRVTVHETPNCSATYSE